MSSDDLTGKMQLLLLQGVWYEVKNKIFPPRTHFSRLNREREYTHLFATLEHEAKINGLEDCVETYGYMKRHHGKQARDLLAKMNRRPGMLYK